MKKQKTIGIILVILGLILTGGSLGSMATYGVKAPITTALIVVVGIVLIVRAKKNLPAA